MLRPMKPQTTDGMAASNSTRTFRNSRVLPAANSAMKMAPPREKGMATTMARPVTLAVPAIRARMPNSGASSSLGNQNGVRKNSPQSIPATKAYPSLVMKTKMPTMKMMADMPQMNTSTWTTLSTYQSALRRSSCRIRAGGRAADCPAGLAPLTSLLLAV